MKANKKFNNQIDKNHSIEWGEATWDNKVFSIRNRYNLPNGKYNKSGSGEIPWNDFKMMIEQSINNDSFTNIELAEILRTISDKIAKIV